MVCVSPSSYRHKQDRVNGQHLDLSSRETKKMKSLYRYGDGDDVIMSRKIIGISMLVKRSMDVRDEHDEHDDRHG